VLLSWCAERVAVGVGLVGVSSDVLGAGVGTDADADAAAASARFAMSMMKSKELRRVRSGVVIGVSPAGRAWCAVLRGRADSFALLLPLLLLLLLLLSGWSSSVNQA